MRAVPVVDETSRSAHPITWSNPDQDSNSRHIKRGPTTTTASSYTEPYSTSLGLAAATEQDGDTTRFVPKLSRIAERRESKTRKHRGSPTGSAITTTKENAVLVRPRHRHAEEDATLNRRATRQPHRSLKRRAESLRDLTNLSLLSVQSNHSQLSALSSNSNSTLTQESYDRTHAGYNQSPPASGGAQFPPPPLPPFSLEPSAIMGRPRGRFRKQRRAPEKVLPSQQNRRPSNASSASSAEPEAARDSDGGSSVADAPSIESPFTSPAASTKRASCVDAPEDDSDSEASISVREASPELPHQASMSDEAEEQQKMLQQDTDEEEEEESSEDESEHGDTTTVEPQVQAQEHAHVNVNANAQAQAQPQAHGMALERMPPPRAPSPSSSTHGDRYSRRLRRQEQALNEHVLQSPQPQRDFQFVGGPSPHPGYAQPMYDPYGRSAASPASLHAAAQHAPLPGPPMSYYSPQHAPPVPYPPGYDRDTAMVARPPMAVANGVAPPPPFPYPPTHPPIYQQHPQEPDRETPTVVGYELLAEKLSRSSKVKRDGSSSSSKPRGSVVPLYRKFEQLNHRVLLHLQDEISEMEEELRHWDECIAQSSARDVAGRIQPASRRGEVRYGSEAHHRRTELLGRIYLKLGQYSKWKVVLCAQAQALQ